MRRGVSSVFAAGLALALSMAAAQAQGPPPGGRGGPGGPGGFGGPGGPGGPGLILAAAVQKDLGFTEKQKAQLKRLMASIVQKRQEMFQEGGPPDPETMRSTMNALGREQEAGIAKILTKSQKARLGQLDLQREGILAVARTEVASKLKLTSTQNKKVKAVIDEMRRTQASVMPGPPGGFGPGGGPGGPGFGPPGEGGPGGPGFGAPGGGGPGGPGFGPPGDGGPGGPGFGPPGAGGPDGGPDDAASGQGQGSGRGGRRGQGGRGGPGRPGDGPPNFDPEEARQRFAKMRETREQSRKTATEAINKILADPQKTTFQEMLGKPFDFSTIQPGPGPGGPPDGGPPNGNGPPRRQRNRGQAPRET